MKNKRPRQAGFSLVETVLAISLLSFAAVMSSRTLLDSTRSIHRLRFQKKASALVEMVFQQYTAYSVQNYQLLSIYNVTHQQPKDFFNRPDNFGYDGILITTLATYSANRSSCTVNVSLNWQDGGTPKSSSFVKTFVETSQLGSGAALQVWLKSPCSQGVDQPSTIANCPGLAGFTLSAPGNSGNTVWGTTDINGQALLKGAQVGTVQVQVTAPTLADFRNSSGAPSFYATVSPGTYVATLTKTLSVNMANLNTLLVTDFKPLGQVTGQFINDDTLVANPPVSGLIAILYGTAVASNGGFATCGNNFACNVTSDSNGNFVINNVVPGTGLSIVAQGNSGSGHIVQQASPNFAWGYSNPTAVTIPSSAWTNPLSVNPANQGPIAQETLHVERKGWVTLQAVNQVTGLPIPNLSIVATSNGHDNALPPTDANGQVEFNNVLLMNTNQQITATTSRSPQNGDHGYAGDLSWTCHNNCMNQNHAVTFPVTPGYVLQGQFVDDSPSPQYNGMYLWAYWTAAMGENNTYLDSNGGFSMDGYFPGSSTPAIPNGQTLNLENDNNNFTATVTGNTTDNDTGGVAQHTTLAFYNGPNTPLYVTSDVSGAFTMTAAFPFTTPIDVTMVCNNTTFVCSVCPAGGTACTAGVGAQIHFDSRQNHLQLVTNDPGQHGYENINWQDIPFSSVGGNAPVTVPCSLEEYAVTGSVTAGATSPLGGAVIDDGTNNQIATSSTRHSTLGSYSGWANVQNRNSRNAGTISFATNLQVISGQSYQASQIGPIALPADIDPTVAIIQNIPLTPLTVAGNGSGI